MKSYFIDTNILIDVLTGRDGAADSQQLFAFAYLGKVELSVSSLSYVNAVYICKRLGMNVDSVLLSLQKFSQFIRVLDLSSDNVISNLSAGWKDYEDATQAYCASENSLPTIVTRNAKDFKLSRLNIISPKEAVLDIL